MKKFFSISLAIVALSFIAACSKQGDQPQQQSGNSSPSSQPSTPGSSGTATTTPAPATKGKYGLKSGVITMKTEAMGQDIVTTIYFDDYGKKERQETKMEMDMGKEKIKTSNVMIVNGDGFRYTIDMEKKTGTRMTDYGAGASSTMDMSNVSPKMMKEYNIKKESPVTVLGKTCDVYSMDSKMGKGTFATWQGISMRTDMTMSGMKMKMETTKLDENETVSASKFEVPKDVKIQEMK